VRSNYQGFFNKENREPKSKAVSDRLGNNHRRLVSPLKKTRLLGAGKNRNRPYKSISAVHPKKTHMRKESAQRMHRQIHQYRPSYLRR
jgi:hypothetical protein